MFQPLTNEDFRPRFTLDDAEPFTLWQFMNDNPDAEESALESIRQLRIGQTVTLGGGAAATFILKRVR